MINYHIGQRFKLKGYDTIYLLAQVAFGAVGLISLTTYNRWVEPVKVDVVNQITEKEFNAICGSGAGRFKLKTK